MASSILKSEFFGLNAADQVKSIDFAKLIASAGLILRSYFPSGSINFSPWRDDPQTQRWVEEESLDLAFHFPGWSSKAQCKSLLIELRVVRNDTNDLPRLLGVIMRGISFDGERWRFATVGDWELTGSHLPHPLVKDQLHAICRDLFKLFHSH